MPTLYLFIGYPGAGKTTIASIISKVTGAKHIWADVERHKLFPKPTHSESESQQLYAKLNSATDYLLSQGKSVVFDTNFNHYADRQRLSQIAKKNKAKTEIIWVTTPQTTAFNRSVKNHTTRNLYDYNMSEDQFSSIAAKLEPPKASESVIKLDGTNLSEKEIIAKLKLR